MTRNVLKSLANPNRVNCLFDMIAKSDILSFYETEEKKNVFRAQKTVKDEEDKTSFSLGRSAERFVGKSAVRSVGTTCGDCQRFVTTRFPESKFRKPRTGAVPRLDLGLQGLLYPSWARESAGRMRGEVSSSVFVTLGLSSAVKELPLRSSVFVVDCLRLRLPSSSSLWGVVSCKRAATSLVPRASLSSSASVFVSMFLSSSVSVVVPGGWSRGRRLSVRCSTSNVWKTPWRARSK